MNMAIKNRAFYLKRRMQSWKKFRPHLNAEDVASAMVQIAG